MSQAQPDSSELVKVPWGQSLCKIQAWTTTPGVVENHGGLLTSPLPSATATKIWPTALLPSLEQHQQPRPGFGSFIVMSSFPHSLSKFIHSSRGAPVQLYITWVLRDCLEPSTELASVLFLHALSLSIFFMSQAE